LVKINFEYVRAVVRKGQDSFIIDLVAVVQFELERLDRVRKVSTFHNIHKKEDLPSSNTDNSWPS